MDNSSVISTAVNLKKKQKRKTGTHLKFSYIWVSLPVQDTQYDPCTFTICIEESLLSRPKEWVYSVLKYYDYSKFCKLYFFQIPVFHRGGYIIPQKNRVRRASSLTAHDPYTLVIALDSEVIQSTACTLELHLKTTPELRPLIAFVREIRPPQNDDPIWSWPRCSWIRDSTVCSGPCLSDHSREATVSNEAINICRYYYHMYLLVPLTKGHLSNVATIFWQIGWPY